MSEKIQESVNDEEHDDIHNLVGILSKESSLGANICNKSERNSRKKITISPMSNQLVVHSVQTTSNQVDAKSSAVDNNLITVDGVSKSFFQPFMTAESDDPFSSTFDDILNTEEQSLTSIARGTYLSSTDSLDSIILEEGTASTHDLLLKSDTNQMKDSSNNSKDASHQLTSTKNRGDQSANHSEDPNSTSNLKREEHLSLSTTTSKLLHTSKGGTYSQSVQISYNQFKDAKSLLPNDATDSILNVSEFDSSVVANFHTDVEVVEVLLNSPQNIHNTQKQGVQFQNDILNADECSTVSQSRSFAIMTQKLPSTREIDKCNIHKDIKTFSSEPPMKKDNLSFVHEQRKRVKNDLVIREGWKPIKQTKVLFENLSAVNQQVYREEYKKDIKCSSIQTLKQKKYNTSTEPSTKLKSDINFVHEKRLATINEPEVFASASTEYETPPPMPIDYGHSPKLQNSGFIYEEMEFSSDTKTTFLQRREQELDNILYALQSTVKRMEKDCFANQSMLPPANFGRTDVFNVDRPSDEDFVCPPLPPPPSVTDLATDDFTNSSSRVEITQPSNLFSPTYKAQAKFNVWTPKSNNKTNGNAEVIGVKTNPSAPVGFRSVARPVSKNFSLNFHSSLSSALPSQLLRNSNCNNNNGVMPVNISNNQNKNHYGKPVHKTTVNIHLDGSDRRKHEKNMWTLSSSTTKPDTYSNHPSESVLNETQRKNKEQKHTDINNRKRGQLVTLLRDTRNILIKPAHGETQSSTTTSYIIPDHGLPKQSENVRVTPKNELPDGAVYETQTLEDDVLHTDTYYPTPGEKTVLERTKKTTIIKAEHHDGMGPTDEKGVPVALRSSVENQKEWYKNMFKQIHKFDSEDDEKDSHPAENTNVQEDRPIVSQSSSYKPRKPLGRITDYTPSEHVVENKPKKSSADYSIWRGKQVSEKSQSITINSIIEKGHNKSSKVKRRSPSLEDFLQKEWGSYFDDISSSNSVQKNFWQLEREKEKAANQVPTASTSYKPFSKPSVNKVEKGSSVEPVHGTDYNIKDSFTMADHVVMEPKHVVTINHNKPKNEAKEPTKRQPAKVKFNFVAQSDKQLTLMKDHVVIITREINKDWYGGETPDGQHSGMFPASYVEVISQAKTKKVIRGLAKAKFDFKASNPKHLSVEKGDSIELIEKIDDNWYKGCIGQRTGILPSNYIEILKEPQEKSQTASSVQNHHKMDSNPRQETDYTHKATPSSSSSNSEPDDKLKMAKASFLANAVVNSGSHLSKPQERKGEFNIPELDDKVIVISDKTNNNHTSQGSYDTTLSTTSSSLHSDFGQNLHIGNQVKLLSSDSSQSSTSTVPMQQNAEPEDDFPPREKHIALYPYVPQNEDELELTGGDSVLVIEKCDDGWFVGTCERTGAFGTFPGNYVIPVE